MVNKEEFIDKYVFGWIRKDFERIKSGVPAIPNGVGNVNFFLALCVLTTMDCLGSFLRGEKGYFEKNVSEYINKCFKNPNEYPIAILKEIFRNGLAHEFFPKGGAISRDGIHPAVSVDDKNRVILDAETLVNDFLISLDKFSIELDENKYQERMKQFEEDEKESQEKCKEIIKDLPKTSGPSFTSSESQTTSSPPPDWNE